MQKEESADPDWVASLAGSSLARARAALREAEGETRLFRHIEREHRAVGRSHYIEIDAPLELYALTRLLRPRHVVEVGVSSGVSSAYLLAALDRNNAGTLHSVDLPKPEDPRRHGSTNPSWSIPAGRSSGWAVPRHLIRRWDLRLGDKRDLLPLFGAELESVEFFVYDVPHSDATSGIEFRAIDRRMPPDAVAIVDHGSPGDYCPALAAWARSRKAMPVARRESGLYAFRARSRRSGRGAGRRGSTRKAARR
jgi:hypothetical protein